MTKPVNFPGRKNERRISVAKRLEVSIGNYYQMLREESGVPAPLTRQQVVTKIHVAERELVVLRERIAKGGKKSTKKVGTNIGRRV